MRAWLLSIAFLITGLSGAFAVELTITVPGDAPLEQTDVTYNCDGRDLGVTYINAGTVSLVTFEIGGEAVVASNVIAASGARYAGGQYVWWTKGDEAQLFDATLGEDAKAILSCTAKD
ncbi:MliC family protein [Mesorhizobium sp. CAU 1732]|uniref:MliC family protein n=1 Tax=Mesorhizobium sp. CAU 1732 TaxID=3140358 RepID=UPI003261AEFE